MLLLCCDLVSLKVVLDGMHYINLHFTYWYFLTVADDVVIAVH